MPQVSSSDPHSDPHADSGTLQAAYQACLRMARAHYENFPVASLFLPRRLRAPVAAIYAFARTADDFADEGVLAPEERLARLDEYALHLDEVSRGIAATSPLFLALGDTIRRYALPTALLHDLLSAFRQDVTKQRYADFGEVLDYCRRSANPIGRLVLHLAGEATADNLRDSDSICTALQLINFMQDVAQDYDENNRIYIPLEDMAAYGVAPADIGVRRGDAAMQHLIALQLQRILTLLHAGAPLALRLRGRLALQIRLTLYGALRVTARLRPPRQDLYSRPRLGARDGLWLLAKALTGRGALRHYPWPVSQRAATDTDVPSRVADDSSHIA